MRVVSCTFLFLLVTACGGGDNSADAVPAEAKYVPDHSTAAGATEAFMRAIETENIGLLSMTLMDDEREKVLPVFEENFKQSKKKGVRWKLEQEAESEWLPEKEARCAMKFTELKDGEPTGVVVGAWYVFIKTSDGSWKYSDAATKRWVAHLLEEQNKAKPSNSPATNAPVD
jgi:hypothetical protein